MQTVIGLEMDDREIRVARLVKNKKEIDFTSSIKLPLGAVHEGLTYDPELIKDPLRSLWQENKLGKTPVVLGVSNGAVLVRVTSFIAGNNLDRAIDEQIKEHIPLNPLEAVIDYEILNEREGGEHSFVECLLVGAKKDMLNAYINLLLDNRINLVEVESSGLALTRLNPYPDKAVVMVDLSYKMGNIVIMQNNIPMFFKFIPNDLLESKPSLETIAEYVSTLLKQSMTYYESQHPEAPIERIVLSGHTAGKLVNHCQQNFNIPVELLTFKHYDNILKYATVIGLTLGGANSGRLY